MLFADPPDVLNRAHRLGRSCRSRTGAAGTSPAFARRRPSFLARGRLLTRRPPGPARPRPQIEADQHALLVGQVADDLLHRRRQTPDQRRHRDDLIAARELRLLQQIDDLDPVASGQMLFADRLEVAQRGGRSGALPGDVQPQDPFVGPAAAPASSSRVLRPRHARAVRGVAADHGAVDRSARTARTSAECAMPRDFRIDRCRPPSFAGRRVAQQDPRVHQRRDADLDRPGEASLPGMRCVKSAVMFSPLRKSISRITMPLTSLERAAGEARQRIDDDDRRLRPRRPRDASSRGGIRGRTASAARRECCSRPFLHPALEIAGRSSACCGCTAPAIPRTESRARARRDGRRRP